MSNDLPYGTLWILFQNLTARSMLLKLPAPYFFKISKLLTNTWIRLKYTTKASQQKSLASLASEYLIRQPLSYGWRLLVGMDNDHAHGESNRQFYGSVVVLGVLDVF